MKRIHLTYLLSLMLSAATGTTAVATELSKRKFEYFSIDVPSWEIREKRAEGAHGRYTFYSPEGRGQHIRVDWNPDASVTVSEVLPMLKGMNFNENRKEVFRTRLGEQSIHYLEMPGISRKVAASITACHEIDVGVMVWTVLDTDWESVEKLHKSVVSTISCSAKADIRSARLTFPEFTAPAGFNRVDNNNSLVYTSKDSIIGFSGALPESKAIELINNGKITFWKTIFTMGDGFVVDSVASEPTMIGGYSVWTGLGRFNGAGPVHYAGFFLTCKKSRTTYAAFYVGSQSATSSANFISLTKAACPSSS